MEIFNFIKTTKCRGTVSGKIEASLNEKHKDVEWGEHRLGDLFEVKTYKKRFDANKVKLLDKGHPYVVRMSTNNGVRGYISEDEKFLNEGNTLSFGQDTATVFYQEQPYFTGDKIKILKSKESRFNKINAQFFVAAISQAFKTFTWGTSSFSVDIIENQKIQLPTKMGKVDFDLMESFITKMEVENVSNLKTYLISAELKDFNLTEQDQKVLNEYEKIEWGVFEIGTLFKRMKTVKLPFKAEDLPKNITNQYSLPCLTSSFKNQGLNYYAPKDGATVLNNVISIPSNSDVYRAYYQSEEFTVLSDAYAIQWIYNDMELLPSQYLFLVSCINKVTDLPIYSYKNKLGGWNVVKNKYIKLPIKDNEPNYDIMNTLISAIQKRVIKNVVMYCDSKTETSKQYQ